MYGSPVFVEFLFPFSFSLILLRMKDAIVFLLQVILWTPPFSPLADVIIPQVFAPAFRQPFAHVNRWFNTVVNQPQFKVSFFLPRSFRVFGALLYLLVVSCPLLSALAVCSIAIKVNSLYCWCVQAALGEVVLASAEALPVSAK